MTSVSVGPQGQRLPGPPGLIAVTIFKKGADRDGGDQPL